MSKEYLELLGKNIRYKKEYIGNDTYRLYIKKNEIELLENYLTELEQIKNSNPSEALDSVDDINSDLVSLPKHVEECDDAFDDYLEDISLKISAIKQSLIKSQEQEKENELLKEIIKSFFDRGCPLHQYTDREGMLQIEVDNECSNMRLGEFKGVDLDKKLKEVLECQKN